MNSIVKVLMERDDMSEQEAQELVNQAREAFQEYLDSGDIQSAYDICEEYFGLEPDYIDEFI